MPYFWFHAFDRDTVADTMGVLRSGPQINPRPDCQTRINEGILGINPPCVYAYLGRPHESFGHVAISLPMDALNGTVSPFDTGGLVDHLQPVNGWEAAARQGYLQRFSWPTAQLAARLADYPSGAPARVRAYLNGQPPLGPGPHAVWPQADNAFVASIWRDNPDWRAWHWEGRSPAQIPVNDNLVAWSCSNVLYGEILNFTAGVVDAADVAWCESLLSKFVSGGVGALVQELRDRQEAA